VDNILTHHISVSTTMQYWQMKVLLHIRKAD
jgi:hypothetical protein